MHGKNKNYAFAKNINTVRNTQLRLVFERLTLARHGHPLLLYNILVNHFTEVFDLISRETLNNIQILNHVTLIHL